jgi:D-amino-acid dehydrogenase
MKVVVLGAGVIGTASAWYLARAGHEVIVLERQHAAGLETSFANGGQISVSHAEPWANPGAPRQILRWLAHEDAPLLFRLRADPTQWEWGLRFLFECLPGRTHDNTVQILAMASYSRTELKSLRAETGIEYDALARGILHIYTDENEFAEALPAAAQLRELGCDLQPKTPEECLAIEPALKMSSVPIMGGTFAPDDESGDACKFTQNLAALCAARGVQFRYGSEICGLRVENGRIGGVALAGTNAGAMLTADAYVVAMGSYSAPLLRHAGIRLPIYPAKGYSITIPQLDEAGAPTVSIADAAGKIVFSRLGTRLRAAGTAELNGYNMQINKVRCEAIVKRTFELFPQAGGRSNIEFWTGLRPATPNNVPYVGRTRFPNLYLNTGHGTLGWTMACGSGHAIADIVSEAAPGVDFRFCMV